MLRDERLTVFALSLALACLHLPLQCTLESFRKDFELEPCNIELVIWNLLCTDQVSLTD